VAVLAAVAVAATACASERSMDNPPPISPEVLATIAAPSTPPPTQATTTAFVPSTAPTTVAPPTQPPPPATYAPTVPPPASQTTAPTTPPPTSATTVPDTLPERYTVVAGDCWSCIARKLGVEMDALLAANGMDSSALILPGETLAVPAGGAVPEPTEQQTSPPTQAPQQTDPPAPEPTEAPTVPPTEPAPPPGNGNNGNGDNGNNGNGNNGNGNDGNGDDGSAGGSTLPPTPGAVRPAETSAACQAEDSEDARGNPVSFSPANLFDRDTGTAWRCAPAAELQLTLRFDAPTHLTSVGLINGYAKVDPETEIDRYIQNHRVRTATWTFADGSSVTQEFEDNNRSMQSMPVDVTTDAVTLTITAHYPNGGPGPRDFVAVAELELIAG